MIQGTVKGAMPYAITQTQPSPAPFFFFKPNFPSDGTDGAIIAVFRFFPWNLILENESPQPNTPSL